MFIKSREKKNPQAKNLLLYGANDTLILFVTTLSSIFLEKQNMLDIVLDFQFRGVQLPVVEFVAHCARIHFQTALSNFFRIAVKKSIKGFSMT